MNNAPNDGPKFLVGFMLIIPWLIFKGISNVINWIQDNPAEFLGLLAVAYAIGWGLFRLRRHSTHVTHWSQTGRREEENQ